MTAAISAVRPISVAVVGHVLNAPVRAMWERVAREAPADHEVRFILSSDDPAADLAGVPESRVDRISRADLYALGFPEKGKGRDWDMDGNLDLVFLEHRRRHPGHARYWFLEYDVHWEGAWGVLFEHFRRSAADVLAATMVRLRDMPHKDPGRPPHVVPPGMAWDPAQVVKAFLPACRLSARALHALEGAYRAGLGGHYEVNVPSVAAMAGLELEDIGGDGPFVRPENRDRFYFAQGHTYSHSPGNFVFRPAQRPLRRPNTLWHPVKPGGVPAWHPMFLGGSPFKAALERAKPILFRAAVRWWFATRWRPLPPDAAGPADAQPVPDEPAQAQPVQAQPVQAQPAGPVLAQQRA